MNPIFEFIFTIIFVPLSIIFFIWFGSYVQKTYGGFTNFVIYILKNYTYKNNNNDH
jgi:hypothetical protein